MLKNLISEKNREIIRYWLKRIPAYLIQSDLTALANWYGTDKGDHGYTAVYPIFFTNIRLRPLSLLEIGIGGGSNIKYGGNSLKMWATYFPKATILGVDIYDKSLLDYRRIQTMVGNQGDQKFLESLGTFDIIIDDGSHINRDIKQSLDTLYPHVSVGGYYCIEDLHVSGLEEYTDPKYPSTMSFLKTWETEHTEDAKVYWHDKLCIIQKKGARFRGT